MDRHSQIARQQFQVLLEKANKRFGKLRELQTRDHSWAAAQSLFHKTFESFSRLWQFQLANRAALLETGLQRSELGAIANKIGQLYYNYYLRSGDTGALLESYTFYDAVHTRQYFASAAAGAPDPATAARQMRFYARFVVVCLFLHRREEAMQLLQELQASVSSYMLQYSSPDAQDWQLVVNEVAALMAADQLAMPLPRSPGSLEVPYTPPLRCRPNDPAAACAPHRPLLHEAILVSYRPRQIKVAELPLELFRMAQALEWQQPSGPEAPQTADGHTDTAPPAVAASGAQAAAPTPGSVRPPVPGAQDADVTGSPAAPGSGSGSGFGVQAVVGPGPGLVPGSGAHTGQAHPTAGGPNSRSSAASASGSGRNPPRQLLHRPTAQRLLSALLGVTAGVDAAAAGDQFVLLYISADAAPAGASEPSTVSPGAPVALPPAGTSGNGGDASASAAAATSPAAAAAAATPRQLLLCPPPPSLPLPLPRHPHGPHLKSSGSAQHHHHHQQQQHQQLQQHVRTPAQHHAAPPGSPPKIAELRISAQHQTQQQQQQQQRAENDHGASGSTATATATAAATAAASDGLLSPSELLSATRRLLLLVLDSDMGPEFVRLQGRERGFPLLCLMSPPWPWPWPHPPSGASADPSRFGSLTAMALSCPAQALCALAGQPDPPPQTLQQLQELLDELLLQVGRQMAEQLAATTTAHAGPACTAAVADTPGNSCGVDGAAASTAAAADEISAAASSSAAGAVEATRPAYAAWAPVFQDCLTRRLLLHFALFRACVHHHPLRSSHPAMAPDCFPPLPPAADPTSELLQQGVRRAAEVLGRPGVFVGPSPVGQ